MFLRVGSILRRSWTLRQRGGCSVTEHHEYRARRAQEMDRIQSLGTGWHICGRRATLLSDHSAYA